jgi:uncharacterized protein YndB with AHSA1/START domain
MDQHRNHPQPDGSPIDVEMSGPIWLKLRMRVPAQPPEEILRWFTEPALLARWMGDAHEVELVPGGRYMIHWSGPNRTMEGAVIVARPTELVFSWAFAHEPAAPARVVMIRTATEPDGSASSVVVIHGPYRNEPDDDTIARETDERDGHLQGWSAFLPILHDRLAASLVAG